ncbi:ankyrin repeat domain-containing protein [Paenibacillus sp. FSL R7-0163]|uniref:ankyrin repeat domain-containing protein n=1 Tax=Paenibacillus sp. FSL R7-0163 TaxID=2954530 RepID=UPI0030D7138D
MKKIPTFALGLIVGITLTAGTAVGAVTYLKATPKTVKIVVGSNQKSVEAMNVNDKLYVGVRDAGSSFGYSVNGVTSSTVTFAEGVTNTTNSASTETNTGNTNASSTKAGGEYVQGLHDKYSTDGKLDAEKVKAAIAAKEITVNAQDKETGNSLLHYAILEDTFALYSVIKVNGLNVDLQNSEKQTPLHLAVIEKSDFYTSELKNLKAKATIKDNSGKQAIDYAEKNSAIETGLTTYMFFNKE